MSAIRAASGKEKSQNGDTLETQTPKKRHIPASFITSSPLSSSKKLRSRVAPPEESHDQARASENEIVPSKEKDETSSTSFSARARSIFSPVFSPVLNVFKLGEKSNGGSSEKRKSPSIECVEEAEAEDEERKENLTPSSVSALASAAKRSEDQDCSSNEGGDGGESNSDMDDDFEDFDPFEFIKNLPANRATPLPFALPKKTRNAPPVSLVLDLDETLVHASLEFMPHAHLTFNVTVHNQDYTVWVKIRPHCIEFLERLADKFELIVFTASQKIYADKLLNLIDPDRRYIKHRVFRDSCVYVHDNYVKDLTVLSRDLAKVAIIDNSPQAFGYQLSNGIPIKSWFGDTQDRCLLKLLPFIEPLACADDVRPHIKNKFKLYKRVASA